VEAPDFSPANRSQINDRAFARRHGIDFHTGAADPYGTRSLFQPTVLLRIVTDVSCMLLEILRALHPMLRKSFLPNFGI